MAGALSCGYVFIATLLLAGCSDVRATHVTADLAEASDTKMRTWREASGKRKIQAELVSQADGTVTLKRADGRVFTISTTALSKEDHDYLREQARVTPSRRLLPADWAMYTSNNNTFRIAFPRKPDDETHEGGGSIICADYAAGLIMSVYQARVETNLSLAEVDSTFKDEVESMNDDDVELKSQRRFEFEGFPAQELIYETPTGDVRHYRSYLTPNGPFTVSYRAPESMRDPKLIAAFFDSFDILEDMPATGNPIASGMRTWTDATGKFRVEAELVEVREKTITLSRSDGKITAVRIERLSQADQDFLSRLTMSDHAKDASAFDSTVAALAAAAWQNYSFHEVGFSADFPNKPLHVTEEDEEGDTTHIVNGTPDGSEAAFIVMYDDLDEEDFAAGPEAILASVVEDTPGIKSHRTFELDGHTGLEITMEVEQGGLPLVVRSRVFLLSSRLLQAIVGRPAEFAEPPEFDRFLNSFRLLEEPEREESEVTGRTYKLTGRSRWPAMLERSQALATRDGLAVGRNYVRTKRSHFLTRDFRFETVFSIKSGDSIVFLGIGEGRGGGPYKEPTGSVHLRIHHESLKSGVALATSGQIGGRRVGRGLPTGVHRAIITKEGDSVTFAIDVDNDGPTPDDMEMTIPNLKALAPNLHSKNSHLFFGGGGGFREITLTYDPATSLKLSPSSEIDPPQLLEEQPNDDPADLGTIDPTQWRVYCWQDTWKPFPLDKATTISDGGALTVTNTTGIHDHCRVVFDEKTLVGDFDLLLEFDGGRRPGIMATSDGETLFNTYVTPGIHNRHVLKIRRRGASLEFTVNGRPSSIVTKQNASPEMECTPFVCIKQNETVSLRRFILE